MRKRFHLISTENTLKQVISSIIDRKDKGLWIISDTCELQLYRKYSKYIPPWFFGLPALTVQRLF